MSHFTAIVALPAIEPSKIPDALASALAPFDEDLATEPRRSYLEDWSNDYGNALSYYGENPDRKPVALDELDVIAVLSAYMGEPVSLDGDGETARYYTITTYNERSKWDWYQVGGRWSDYFVHRAESVTDPRLIVGEKSWSNKGEPRKPYRCDGGPRELLDFEALRDAKGLEAAAKYDKWTALIDGLPAAKPWAYFRDQHAATPDAYMIDRAREDYHAQPVYQAANASEDFRWFTDVIGHFDHSRDEHIDIARTGAVPGYALLTLDGQWIEAGEMGWFGMSGETEDSRAEYLKCANSYLDDLPGDTVLVAVDCHI